MKLLSVPALLAAALLSALVGLPFLPFAQNEAGPFFLEAEITSSRSGAAQLYFDAGKGFSEAASSRTPIWKTAQPRRYRLGFPSGTFRAFRFDPLDRTAQMTVRHLRIVSPAGRVLRTFANADLKPANQITELKPDGEGVAFSMPPNSEDPQFSLVLGEPVVARRTLGDVLYSIPTISIVSFVLLIGGAVSFGRIERLRRAASATWGWFSYRPLAAIGLTAAVAVVVSAYPIVFLGKSYVSPNLGTILLYDAYPALPGYDDHEVADVQLSDVGAMMWQHVPFSMIQHRALAQGELPLWNRYNSLGIPLLGQGQSAFGDPLHFLVVAANGDAWAWDLKYLIAKWLFAFGLGWSVLRATRSVAAFSLSGVVAALIVAAASPFIGFFVYRLNHPAFFSLCYAPWCLACWLGLLDSSNRRQATLWSAGLVVANLALLASGTAKEAYMLLLAMNLAGACAVLSANQPWRARLGRLAAAIWAGLIFVLVTMPIWATFRHTLANAYTSYNAASAFQLQPSMLLGLFDEVFFRPLMPGERVLDPSLNFLLLLGLLYFAATLRCQFANRTVVALAGASLVPLAFAFGLVPPQWIVHWPILANVAHLDNTFSCALIVLWSVLAGVGFATALRRLGTPEGRGDLIIASLLLFALVFHWIAFRQAAHRPVLGPTTFSVHRPGEVLAVSSFVWGDLAALLLACGALALAARRCLVRRQMPLAAAFVLAGCAIVLLWRFALHAPSVGFRGYVQEPTVRVNLHAKSAAIGFVREAVRQEPARGFGLHGNFFPGWTAAYALETVHSPDAIMSPWVRELTDASGIERMWDWRLYVAPEDVGNARPFLDALNVRWYFDLASDQGLLGRSLKLAQVGDLDVYESSTAWPRAYFTDRVLRYHGAAELVAAMKRETGRPLAAVQASDQAANGTALAAVPTDVASRTFTAATGYRLTENTTSFHVHATGTGVVTLLEAWWPDDFRAELNGSRVPVLRLNHAFKGVFIPAAGDYEITFRYWPHHFLRSLLACGTGALLLLGSLWLGLRKSAA